MNHVVMKRRSIAKRGMDPDNEGMENNTTSKRHPRRRGRTRKNHADESNNGELVNDYSSSDVADCSLLPSSNSNTMSAVSISQFSNNEQPRKKFKNNNGRVGSRVGAAVTQQSSAAKTLFSAVMSRSSNVTTPHSHSTTDGNTFNSSHDQTPEGDAENNNNNANIINTPEKQRTTTSNGNVTFLQKIGTPTALLKNKKINHWQKQQSPRKNNSPMSMGSPGGHEILRALDDANSDMHGYYHDDQTSDGEEGPDGNDGRPTEEWHDAAIRFKNPSRDAKNEKLRGRRNVKTREDPTDIMAAEKEESSHCNFASSIVEATKFATDLDAVQCANATPACPEPVGVGVMDWSLKRRVRLECLPGRCLPDSLQSDFDEGDIHQLALQHLSNRNHGEGGSCNRGQNNRRNPSEAAMAKWMASTMYYQHPAVHPLPPSLLEQSNTDKPRNSRRDLSSYLHGSHSIHDRIRRPAAGSMGGLGASVPRDQNNKPNIVTVTSLLDQRRRDWQEAFRSTFRMWKSKLKALENDKGSTRDDLSRCSFYSILPNQVILFRGGYAESHSIEGVRQSIVPVIVFSCTTSNLRSNLKSMGVDLRLFLKRNTHDNHSSIPGDAHDVFSENLLNTEDVDRKEGYANAEGDDVLAELDAIKWADDEGKVTVDRRKKARRDASAAGAGRGAEFPPLFVFGDDDCAVAHELLLNTYGLSIDLGAEVPMAKGTTPAAQPPSDVPLLLWRSLGPCAHATLRDLREGGRRDGGRTDQMSHADASGMVDRGRHNRREESSSARAALELRGPMLPCAVRDMACAMVNFMLLDEEKHERRDRPSSGEDHPDDDDENAAASSHQFAMFLQAHEGECSMLTPKSTGSSSSFYFNGSDKVLLLPKRENRNDDESLAWCECSYGDYINVLVWDVSRKSVVSFNPLSAKA